MVGEGLVMIPTAIIEELEFSCVADVLQDGEGGVRAFIAFCGDENASGDCVCHGMDLEGCVWVVIIRIGVVNLPDEEGCEGGVIIIAHREHDAGAAGENVVEEC